VNFVRVTDFYFDPLVGVRSIAMSVSARLSVCLYLCPARISQKPHVHISPNFVSVLFVVVACSSSYGNAIRYVLPVFVDDVMFPYDGRNSPEYVLYSSPGGGTSGEVNMTPSREQCSRLQQWR